MLVGEISNKTGLSRDTIRFYEKKGLISVGRKERRFNNYKEYSLETLNRLLSVKRIKGLGFTLNETAEFLDLIELNEASCENVSQKMSEKVQLLEKKIKELKEMKKGLIEKMNNCPSQNPMENCPLILSDSSL